MAASTTSTTVAPEPSATEALTLDDVIRLITELEAKCASLTEDNAELRRGIAVKTNAGGLAAAYNDAASQRKLADVTLAQVRQRESEALTLLEKAQRREKHSLQLFQQQRRLLLQTSQLTLDALSEKMALLRFAALASGGPSESTAVPSAAKAHSATQTPHVFTASQSVSTPVVGLFSSPTFDSINAPNVVSSPTQTTFAPVADGTTNTGPTLEPIPLVPKIDDEIIHEIRTPEHGGSSGPPSTEAITPTSSRHLDPAASVPAERPPDQLAPGRAGADRPSPPTAVALATLRTRLDEANRARALLETQLEESLDAQHAAEEKYSTAAALAHERAVELRRLEARLSKLKVQLHDARTQLPVQPGAAPGSTSPPPAPLTRSPSRRNTPLERHDTGTTLRSATAAAARIPPGSWERPWRHGADPEMLFGPQADSRLAARATSATRLSAERASSVQSRRGASPVVLRTLLQELAEADDAVNRLINQDGGDAAVGAPRIPSYASPERSFLVAGVPLDKRWEVWTSTTADRFTSALADRATLLAESVVVCDRRRSQAVAASLAKVREALEAEAKAQSRSAKLHRARASASPERPRERRSVNASAV
jgi:hypothetical protein